MNIDIEYSRFDRNPGHPGLLMHFTNRCSENIFALVDMATRL